MKKLFLLSAILALFIAPLYVQAADDKKSDDDILRKSQMFEPPNFGPDKSSFPMRFQEIGNPVTQPPISTGYYFVDSDDQAPDYWRPSPSIIDTTEEPNLWRRILPGPRLRDPNFWPTSTDGLRFFRNPALPLPGGDFFNGPTDSTDDAIAGPMPIGFNFYFNGLKYDSFYVSTNGVIALTNDRYFYDNQKNRIVPPGATDCYNPMSMDWFYAGRGRNGDGLNDPIDDDFGYYYSVCGGNPMNATGGIRTRGGFLNQGTFTANKSALISPFFGDLHMSQYNTVTNQPEDWAKCFFKRSNNSDKLIIYFINMAPVRILGTPYGAYYGNFDLRPGDQNYIAASAQVILDKRDSSVNIVYERFDGVAVVNGRGVPATTIFRYNTTVGVHGFARHTNYGQPGGETKPWAGEYQQYTHYYARYSNPQATYPHNYLAIKFKQWKNTLRVVDIAYRVRKSDPNADLEFTETVPTQKVMDYELLAGDERNGAIQPVAIIQNLTNEIQGPNGVNYQKQQLNFRARFRIINEASLRIVYNRLVPIDSSCLALGDTNAANCTGDPYTREKFVTVSIQSGNYTATELPFPGPNSYNGIPPYGFVQVFFPPFEPNEFVNNHIGRMKAFIIADPTHPRTNETLGDTWPFDDTASVRLFSMKRLDDFNDDVTSYHIVNRAPMPSTLKWVNIDAEVASGDDVSIYPLPPRGTYPPTNNFDFKFTDPDFTRDTRESPVIRMTRKTLAGLEPAKSPGGDQLRSFPIDLRGKYGAVLSLSLQRNAKRDDWPRGWSDQELVGPEPRTVVNADPFSVWTLGRAASAPPDELTVEFAQPSPDGIRYITNIDDKKWRQHPRRDGAKPVTNMPVLSLYGAGGYLVGWLESDRDSALSPPANPNLNGLRPDIFDDGVDFEYKKFFLAIPDTFIKSENEGAKNFRFRLNMQARNNKKCIACIPDDDDPYFVDNVRILFPSEVTDIEMSLVKILWPYTIAPASQGIKVPVRVKISNNTNVAAPPFRIKVRIYMQPGDPAPIYCRTENIPFMTGRTNVTVPMPNWNARRTGDGEYFMLANLLFGDPDNPDQDLEPLNDTNFSFVTLKFGDVFAYDPEQNPRNDVPDNAFTGIPGRGLNLFGFAYGGMGSSRGPAGGYDENNYGAGYVGGSGSGQIAMKFTLYQQDTIYGYNAFFGTLNQAYDDISLAVYRDANQPSTIINGSLIYKFRGFDDIRRETFWDEYVTYLLPEPIVLDAGSYWMAIAQLGETGLELGASKTRMGMRITSIYIPPPITRTSPVGGSGYHLCIDKDFRRENNTGALINDNKFALENTRGSGQWAQFMPTIGNPAYAHLHHFGTSPADGYTLTLSRGGWIPMIRPYFGERSSGYDKSYQVCPDDIPVELTSFDGLSRSNGIELFWETASEINNEGFYVEKRNNGSEVWNSIGFIKGAGNSNSVKQYAFIDRQVQPNVAYQYRLRQVDRDGALSCESFSQIVTLTFDGTTELSLEQNVPNPVANHTSITFTVPEANYVRLEVLDIFGNVVKTLVNENVNSGSRTVEWNAVDNNNNIVPSGSYIVRLVSGNDVRTINMTVVR